LQSVRAVPQAALDEGFSFRHNNLQSALTDLLG
jgi:NAD dependent epimerase/dehydratase family enzyme